MDHSLWKILLSFAVAVLFVAERSIAAGLESPTCDASVLPGRGTFRYRPIGDRCEGEFRQPVASKVELLSLTYGVRPVNSTGLQAVDMRWTATTAAPPKLSLLARITAPHVYYKMTRSIEFTASHYIWTLNEMRAAGYATEPLGMFARAELHLDGTDRDVFVPLSVTSLPESAGDAHREQYFVVFSTGDEVHKVYATLVDHAGGSVRPIWNNEKRIEALYAPTRPVTLPVPRSELGPGWYELQLQVDTARGSSPLPLRFVHD